jgi:predicted  nucleic acid-binding Zn-ribbon protein
MAFTAGRILAAAVLVFATGISSALSVATRTASPIQKVVSLLTSLEAKVIKDGEVEQKAFAKYVDWCKNGAKDLEFSAITAQSEIEDLTATIGQAESDIQNMDSKVGDLTTEIASNEADLKAATGIRKKEHAEFATAEKELVDAVDTLERAINVLARKLHGSALLQAQVSRKDIGQLIHALGAVIDAAAMSFHDKQTLIGLVQNNDDSDDDDVGAPAPDAYKAHSGSIVDVLEDLKQKAVTELEEARRQEVNARHNFELTKQSLVDAIKCDNKELAESKTLKHSATETKAVAEGELELTKKELADSQDVLKNMKGNCMAAANDHESSVQSRAEELKAIAAAKKAIMENTSGANEVVYGGSASFLQLDGAESSGLALQTGADLAGFEVVNLIRKLARDSKSVGLAQLAGKISATMRQGTSGGQDPFVKVKGMINDMLVRLEKEAGEEANHKAYCDKEMAETKTKLGELKYDIEKLSSKIDKLTAESAKLKDEAATLSREIAAIVKSQSEADAYRREEHAAYVQTKADLEEGLKGIRMALQVLRDYYGSTAALVQQPSAPVTHSKSDGAGSSILGMLEVVESDLGKSLASTEMEEETAAVAYEKVGMENRVSKAMKEKDVEYKSKTAVSNDKAIVELTQDRESAQTELDAVLSYSANIRGMCEVKPESYEQRVVRREQEVSGLRQALQILDGEAVFLQRRTISSHRSGLRIATATRA